ncbi:response regulator [Rugamonas sp.]|uniref:response regulator n=1 Tax=Rugamonas sp. TaxID=1926287 RepID=UPI0025EA0691|nr:response regulator [Rugamonas sp.]
MTTILLLDDESRVLSALQRALRAQTALPDLRVEVFTDPFLALNRVCVHDFDLAISDYRMPRMSGVDFLRALRDVAPRTVRMMLSASTEFDTVMQAVNEAQIFRFIPKPWLPADLEQAIALACEHRRQLLPETAPPAALTPQELEARRLEAEEPGILRVRRAPDGSILM